jgi:hypothetical protein
MKRVKQYRHGMNSWLALGLILGLLFVVSVNLDFALFANNGYRPLNNFVYNNTSNFPLSASAVDGVNNLRLSMSISNTTVPYGQSFNVYLDLWNILNTNNTVNAKLNWSFPLTPSPCQWLYYPIAFAIYKGYYTASNLSIASAVPLYPMLGAFNCPADPYLTSYTFSPNSNNATFTQGSSSFPEPVEIEVPVSGFYGIYWLGGFLSLSDNLQSFPPSVYTVAGGDEWGQMVILHFKVI